MLELGGPGGSCLVTTARSCPATPVRRTTGSASIRVASAPASRRLSGDPDYTAGPRPRYEPRTLRNEAAWLKKAAGYALDCGWAGGRLLGHLKTTDSVVDMDAIRQTLGEEQLNFFGYSYARTPEVYVTQHPDRVRRMVLDSNVDPTRVWYDANIDQDFVFETVIQIFFDWVARHDGVYGLVRRLPPSRACICAALESLSADPQGMLGASEWTVASLGAGYVQFLWPDVAAAFVVFVNDGDAGAATDLYLGQDTPGRQRLRHVPRQPERTDARWSKLACPGVARVHASSRTPRSSHGPTCGSNAPCVFWPAIVATPVDVDGSDVPPILLSTRNWTRRRRSRAASRCASLPAVVAHRHRRGHEPSSLFGGAACVDDAVAAYLADGSLPERLPAVVPRPSACWC